MAMAGKDRFKEEVYRRDLKITSFPPDEISLKGRKLEFLGKSNYNDLLKNPYIAIGLPEGSKIGQFVYSDENGDLYELTFTYNCENESVVFYSARTRIKPPYAKAAKQ